MRRIIVAALAVVVATSVMFGQGGGASAEQSLLKLTDEWFEAEAKVDRAALERLVADDFIGTSPTGRSLTKTDVIPAAGTRSGLQYRAQDVKARVFGDAGVVTGRGVSRGQGPEMRFTVVYARRQDRWQMVVGHISVLPQEQP